MQRVSPVNANGVSGHALGGRLLYGWSVGCILDGWMASGGVEKLVIGLEEEWKLFLDDGADCARVK